jgi:hypothetical protein
VKSALRVFEHDVDNHLRAAPCAGSRSSRHWVPMPALEPEDEMVWE